MKLPREFVENFVLTEEGTVQMCNVWLDVDGKRLLATNGHMAIRCTTVVEDLDATGVVPVEAFALARKELKSIAKLLGSKDQLPDPGLKIECGTEAVFIENLLTHTTHLVPRPQLGDDQKFPDIDRVMPSFERKPSITLNRDYLALIAKNLTSDSSSLSLWIDSDDKVAGFAVASGKAVVALMPMRGDVDLGEIAARGARGEVVTA